MEKDSTKSGWGGKREGGGWPRPGPGRPRKAERSVQVNVKLSPALAAKAKRLGGGNTSAGIRRALELAEDVGEGEASRRQSGA